MCVVFECLVLGHFVLFKIFVYRLESSGIEIVNIKYIHIIVWVTHDLQLESHGRLLATTSLQGTHNFVIACNFKGHYSDSAYKSNIPIYLHYISPDIYTCFLRTI